MILNKTQKTIILVALFFVVAMILYPPWVIGTGSRANPSTGPGPYTFICSPPKAARFIDLYRLSVQLFGLFVIAVGLCFVCSTTKRKKD